MRMILELWGIASVLVGAVTFLVTPKISAAVTAGVWFLIATVAIGLASVLVQMQKAHKELNANQEQRTEAAVNRIAGLIESLKPHQ